PIDSPMYFQLTTLSKVGTDENPAQPDVLLSANNGAGVVGDIQTLSVGPLGTSQSTPVFLLIGVGSRQPFTIYIDLYAALTGSASTALSDGVLNGKSAAVRAKTIVGPYQ